MTVHFYDFHSTEVRCRIFPQEKSAFTTIFLTKMVWHLFSFDEASVVIIYQQSNFSKTKMKDFSAGEVNTHYHFIYFYKWLVFVQFHWSDQVSPSTNNITRTTIEILTRSRYWPLPIINSYTCFKYFFFIPNPKFNGNINFMVSLLVPKLAYFDNLFFFCILVNTFLDFYNQIIHIHNNR